jgi:hypothetical protein
MKPRSASWLAAFAALATVAAAPVAQHDISVPVGIRLSPALLELLRAEMREIAGGVQVISVSLATGSWDAVHDAAASIRASYIMEKSLTPEQTAELGRSLPGRFKELDAEFHARAEKLAQAAAARDAELAGFHYARLLETCTRCHAEFAAARFPGFTPAAAQEHRH